MTNLEKLKISIENKSVSDDLKIFKLSNTDFVCNQYIGAISELLHKHIIYVDNIDFLFQKSLFGEPIADDEIVVYKCDKLEDINELIFSKKCVIIITYTINKSLNDKYSSYIYEVPKLENWQIKDYVYSVLGNISQNKLDLLIDKCKYNLFRIQSEIDKILIFDESLHSIMFDTFLSDNVFSDLSKYSIFDFTNAIIKRNKVELANIYKEKDNIDIEPIGVVTLLLNSFRDIITLQFDPRLTPETSGIPKNRFWAIKYSCGYYSNNQLIDIFKMLCTIDKRIKTGAITTDILIDYLLVNIL